MIDLERIERKERKKGADPPDHPRAKGSRRTRASIGVPYHRLGVELYLDDSALATRVVPLTDRVST